MTKIQLVSMIKMGSYIVYGFSMNHWRGNQLKQAFTTHVSQRAHRKRSEHNEAMNFLQR